MKVLLVNGSPHRKGNTSAVLAQVAKALEAQDVACETFWLGTRPIKDCMACGKCEQSGRCAMTHDVVNNFIDKAAHADGFVFGMPVYYSHPAGRALSVIGRAFRAGKTAFSHKPAATVVVARGNGAPPSDDIFTRHFFTSQMPVVTSVYWNSTQGRYPGEAFRDENGQLAMLDLAENMAWMLRCVEAGRAAGVEPPKPRKPR